MDTNYRNFCNYLKSNDIRFEQNDQAKLIRFGYNIDYGTIEIVADFEHENRIALFSFLSLSVAREKRIKALELANNFNESLNYGSIIVSQVNQLVYKVMYSSFDFVLKDEQWSEIIFRLWSISKDIYPLFGRLIFAGEEPESLFEEFLINKEKPAKHESKSPKAEQSNPWSNLKDWFMQN